MCIAFWLLEAHPEYKLLLALNRDEYYSRPTLPAHRWTDQVNVNSFLFLDLSFSLYSTCVALNSSNFLVLDCKLLNQELAIFRVYDHVGCVKMRIAVVFSATPETLSS